MSFKILTVGWEPSFIDYLLAPLADKAGIDFIHGVVGDASRLEELEPKYPNLKLIALSKKNGESLPPANYEFLAQLESVGVVTIRSMMRGDRVLRHLQDEEVYSYITLLANKLFDAYNEHRPDVILASYDNAHSALSLAVAKSLGIPWVALAFAVIPDNLTGFCKALTPDQLVPLRRNVDERLREQARSIIRDVRGKRQQVLAFRPPSSVWQWARQYLRHVSNFLRRARQAKALGVDRFTYPSGWQQFFELGRRLVNRVRLPEGGMLRVPPVGKFIYYPMHMAPESMLDTWAPFYQNQLAFVEQLSFSVPADIKVVVKLHFSDPDNYSYGQLKHLMRLPQTYIAHPNAPGRAFIEQAALVVGIQGTSCIEAALLGKPVLIFGDSPYQHFPRSERARRPDELYEQIRRMLAQPAPTDKDIVEAYAAYMARYMPGRINDWSRPISEEEYQRYADCFIALKDYLADPVNRDRWYQTSPFVPTGGAQIH